MAREECKNHEGQLGMIGSTEVQDNIIQLIKPITNSTGKVHVWTSGKLSNESNWYYVNNSRVQQGM